LHFDLAITCDLREDTPTPCIEFIEWLFTPPSEPLNQPQGHCFDNEGRNFYEWFDYPFLYPLPDEEFISVFQKRHRYTTSAISGSKDVYRYALQYSGRHILDDGFYEDYLNFVAWLATIAEEGFIGYYKEQLASHPRLLYVRERNLVIE
jgi:hypothetical protein